MTDLGRVVKSLCACRCTKLCPRALLAIPGGEQRAAAYRNRLEPDFFNLKLWRRKMSNSQACEFDEQCIRLLHEDQDEAAYVKFVGESYLNIIGHNPIEEDGADPAETAQLLSSYIWEYGVA